MNGAGGPRTAHINPVTPREMRYIIRHSGLELLESKPIGLMPFVYIRAGLKWTLSWALAYLATPFIPSGMKWGAQLHGGGQKTREQALTQALPVGILKTG